MNIISLLFEIAAEYVLEIIPVMLLSGFIYLCWFFYRAKQKNIGKIDVLPVLTRFLFVCYFSGIIALTLTPPNLWSALWRGLFSGYFDYPITIKKMLSLSYNFVPSLYYYLTGELTGGAWINTMILGNILMFVPMGVLVPVIRKKDSFLHTELFCILTILAIELIQPFIARSFDTDDIIYNTIGATIGFLCFALIKKLFPNLISKCKGNTESNGIF